MKECIFIEDNQLFIYGEISVKDTPINYRKTKTIKNNKRQSFYDMSKIFNINYVELKSDDFKKLKNLAYSNVNFHIYYQNEKYKCIIDLENGFEYNSEYSELLSDDLYKGTLIFEQIFEQDSGGVSEW